MSLDFAKARENMVDSQVRTNDVTDLPVQDAMGVVARERFCPAGQAALAYAEIQIEYAPGWRMMEPRDIAKLLQAVFPRPGERALAIAAPYAAAVLAQMGLSVGLITPAGEAETASRRGLDGLPVLIERGDVKAIGIPAEGAFDVLLCEGAVTRPPQSWLDAIAPGGRLGVVERQGPVAVGCVYKRAADGVIAKLTVFDATAELMPGFEPAPAFSF